jgi:hypothetical protein
MKVYKQRHLAVGVDCIIHGVLPWSLLRDPKGKKIIIY